MNAFHFMLSSAILCVLRCEFTLRPDLTTEDTEGCLFHPVGNEYICLAASLGVAVGSEDKLLAIG